MQEHREDLPGNQRGDGDLIPVRLHADCSRWVEERYRICADVSEGWGEDGVGGGWNVFYLKGRWYRQHYINTHPPGILEGAFFHFQARYLVITPPSTLPRGGLVSDPGVEVSVRAAALVP